MPDIGLVDQWAQPGMGTPVVTTELEILFGVASSWQVVGVVLDSGCVDARNSPTSQLSRGLVLGRIGSSGNYTNYSKTATDGSQIARGVLYQDVNMLDQTQTAVAKQGRMVWFGNIKAAQCGGLDLPARRSLTTRIAFDDDFMVANDLFSLDTERKTTGYTVLATDNNKLFTNRGAVGSVTFTLPAIGAGYRFQFAVEADQAVTVASAEGTNMVVPNNAGASSVAFSTAGDQIGASCIIMSNDAGTKWIVLKTCPNAMTIA